MQRNCIPTCISAYTRGDLLDDPCLDALADAGLDEVRFSIKPEDVARPDAPVFGRIEAAVSSLPDVMVEMPVIPGTLSEMQELLVRLDDMGVRGVNLLEFCFPLCNAEAFRDRGFELRKHPFNYLYDYWYGGGVPVAGSEAEALTLMEYAVVRACCLVCIIAVPTTRIRGRCISRIRCSPATMGCGRIIRGLRPTKATAC